MTHDTKAIDLRQLFTDDAKRQRYLDVEAALAQAEAQVGIIPAAAAVAITAHARLDQLDRDRLRAEHERTGHSMVALVSELARVVGADHGGWVHWGATTQNIQQTGDVLGWLAAHHAIRSLLDRVLHRLADLADEYADTAMPGRTHWQHAVPITFGFKIASWIDPMLRHRDRLDELRPRLARSMTGGAAGTFATLGDLGPAVQDGVAQRLRLTPMAVPSRNIVDHFAEFVCVLGMIAATATSIAEEIMRGGATEFGEFNEATPTGDVGSSTMPQKRNAKRSGGTVTNCARVRAQVPLAMEAMIQSFEVDGSRSAIMDDAVDTACIYLADGLNSLADVLETLEVHPERMRANLNLTGGLITAERVMITLGEEIGRQEAHEVVHSAAQATASNGAFAESLLHDQRVSDHLDREAIKRLLDPSTYVGLSAQIARQAALAVQLSETS